MRINSISIAQPRNINYKMKARNEQTQPVKTEQPQFKGLKAGAYGVLGTFIGGATAALLSGGALLPILLAGAAGTTGGCIYGKSKEGHKSDDYYDYGSAYPNPLD